MSKQLDEVIALHGLLCEADAAGYLDTQDQQAVQKMRLRFNWCSQALALSLLKRHGNAIVAKNELGQQFRQVLADSNTKEILPEEFDLLRQLEASLGQVIDREASRSEWQRTLTRTLMRVPGVVWVLIASAAIVVAVIAVSNATR